ncbi:MAG: hypothetical protein EA345_12150 [Halomonas sp.]|nr:MAG: hypothetical protein EA345_12150 [Halomonas sp.]
MGTMTTRETLFKNYLCTRAFYTKPSQNASFNILYTHTGIGHEANKNARQPAPKERDNTKD